MTDVKRENRRWTIPNPVDPSGPFVVFEEDPVGDIVLPDRTRDGFELRFKSTGANACERIQAYVQKRYPGASRAPQQTNAPLVYTPDIRLSSGPSTRITIALHGYDLDDGVIFTSGSFIELNPQRMLRDKHGIPAEVVGVDRKRNYCKPTAECDATDVVDCFETRVVAVEGVLEMIKSALPGAELVEGRLSPQVGEMCHDVACEDADAVVRAASRVPTAGSKFSWQSEHECTVGQGKLMSFRYADQVRGPVNKGYVKKRNKRPALDVIRLELSCLHRDAIKRCLGDIQEYEFSGAGALRLAVDFYNEAGERCIELLEHVRNVSAGSKTRLDLQRSLAPLHGIAEGRREGPGYTPNKRAQADAKRILNQLYDGGIADVSGQRKGTKLREVLDRLVRPEGPLVRGATIGVVCVAPEFGMGSMGRGE